MLMEGIKKWGTAHASEIFAAVTIAASGVAIGFTAYESPKAAKLLKEEEFKKHRPLTVFDKAKTVWRNYIPTAVFYGLAIASSIGSVHMGNKQVASLTAACTLAESALTTYQRKVVEVAGETQEKEIRKQIAKEQAVTKEPSARKRDGVAIVPSQGILCFDVISGRFFESGMDSIEKAVNTTNERLLQEGYVSLNELYGNLGLEMTDIYEDIGWNILVQGLIKPEFDSFISEDGRPCLTLDFQVKPVHDFENAL